MKSATLHIVTAVANPIRWKSRISLTRAAIASWLSEPQIDITIVECAYGAGDYELDDMGTHERVTHIPVRATTMAWSKENLLNIGMSRLPHTANYVAFFDADIIYRKSGWAGEALKDLQLYPVIQPWKTCYDLGPNDEHLAAFQSFASLYHKGSKVIPRFDPKTLVLTNSPYAYPHPGYCWAWQIGTIGRIGGLFEYGACGAGDHHMALALIGKSDASLPKGINADYVKLLKAWEARALSQVNKKLGFCHQTIEHPFHGRKADRKYNFRWFMLLDNEFDPITDLKKNQWGVIEWAGNKPDLERLWDNYMRDREEDVNTVT
jgi:hypothetical protein